MATHSGPPEQTRITVVGLGPGGTSHVTAETLDAIDRIERRHLRTERHPTAGLVTDAPGGAVTHDDVYDSADTFDDVYATIVERLVADARERGEILYAVPGSPLVLERTVAALREWASGADAGVALDVLPAMSFLDVAWARLGVDPVEARATLVDGHTFAEASAGLHGPLLVAHVHADWVLSEIKLARDEGAVDADGDERVVALQRLGTPDESIVETTWDALDRDVDADHLTTLWIPRLGVPVGAEYVRFHRLARTLREQCPWDVEQTHESLVPYLLEETYEVVDALHALDPDDPSTDDDLVEELGDLLYQIEFHATIAEQEGRFTIAEVAQGIHDKLVRRHPHVFGDTVADDTGTVLTNWDDIKRAEKQARGRTSIFDGIARSMPSLSYAAAVGTKASKVGFDWPDVSGALPKVSEEIAEVDAAIAGGDPAEIVEEIGDLLFATVNVARHVGIDPELALRAASDKFRTRFEKVEELAVERGIDLRAADLSTLDALWDEVKATID